MRLINTCPLSTLSQSSVQKVEACFWELTELPNTLYRLYVKKVGVLAVGGKLIAKALTVMLMFTERRDNPGGGIMWVVNQ